MMTLSHSTMKRRLVLLICAATVSALASSSAQPPTGRGAAAQPCTRPEYHQFDFWVGDWDTFDVGKPAVVKARNHVDRILDGCALREVYDAVSGLRGQSFTMFDATRSVWHQSWVTNHGELLVLEGRLEGEQMILSGNDHLEDGTPATIRGIWRLADGGVRETAERSSDGGRTWKPLFDIVFRKHKS
jgi:hypothetical protein